MDEKRRMTARKTGDHRRSHRRQWDQCPRWSLAVLLMMRRMLVVGLKVAVRRRRRSFSGRWRRGLGRSLVVENNHCATKKDSRKRTRRTKEAKCSTRCRRSGDPVPRSDYSYHSIETTPNWTARKESLKNDGRVLSSDIDIDLTE